MADYTSIFTGAEIDGRLAGVVADFDPGKTYYVGDYALYENQVYRKTQNPGAGGFVVADWEPATIGDGLSGIPDAVRAWLDAHPEVPMTVQDGSITRQKLATTLAQEITKHGSDIDVLDSRVDEILGLTPGSTTGDAQLADIKIGWDGATYDTPGDAVREQVSRLSESIAEISDGYLQFELSSSSDDFIDVPFEETQNKLTDNTTLVSSTFNGFQTTIIDVDEGDIYRISGWAGSTQYKPAFWSDTQMIAVMSLSGEAYLDVTTPTGATKLMINGRSSAGQPISIKKKITHEINEKSKQFWNEFSEIKNAINNSGKFGVSVSNSEIKVFIHNYEENRDLCVHLKRKSSNGLMDIQKVTSYPNDSEIVLVDDTGLTERRIIGGDTDFLSPSIVYAVNDLDGDFADMTSQKLTGGWHGYNNATGGATATARNLSCKVFCDGKEIAPGTGARGNSVVIDIVNRLQGSNTEKSDGTGREIVEQKFRLVFREDFTIVVDGEITALEDIHYDSYFGVSLKFSMDSPVYFVGCRANRGANAKSSSVRCGDKYCIGIKQAGNDDTIEMLIDATYDIGTMYANKSNYSCNINDGKAYANLIAKTGSTAEERDANRLHLLSGDKAYWRGYYKCRPTH